MQERLLAHVLGHIGVAHQAAGEFAHPSHLLQQVIGATGARLWLHVLLGRVREPQNPAGGRIVTRNRRKRGASAPQGLRSPSLISR